MNELHKKKNSSSKVFPYLHPTADIPDYPNFIRNAWQAQLPDDGSGALRVWRVKRISEDESALVEVERPQAAVFFARDCYIALYTYHAPTGDQSILYYWMVTIVLNPVTRYNNATIAKYLLARDTY